MLTLAQADEFFQDHPLQMRYLEFSEKERQAALSTAARDVAAALEMENLPETLSAPLCAAVCEQAVFLLLNAAVLTGSAAAGGSGNLSPRAHTLLASVDRSDCGGSSIRSINQFRLVRG